MSDASSERASDDESEVELSIFRYGVLVLTGRFDCGSDRDGDATDRSLEVD